MKRYNNIFLAALFGATLLLGGCREEEKIADDLYIPGLGGEEYAENELDKWLYQNYTLPYNIDVVYAGTLHRLTAACRRYSWFPSSSTPYSR